MPSFAHDHYRENRHHHGLKVILAVLMLPWVFAGLYWVRVIVAICLGYLNPWDWVSATVELVAVILWIAMPIAAFSWELWEIWWKPNRSRMTEGEG